MKQMIRHLAVVQEIGSDRVIVSIEQKSACAGCHAASYCCSADCRERLVSALKPAETITVGEQVELEGRAGMGWLAIILSFVLPLVILITSLFLCMLLLQFAELPSAAIALGVIALYYIGIRLFGRSLRDTFVFTIKKINRPQDI